MVFTDIIKGFIDGFKSKIEHSLNTALTDIENKVLKRINRIKKKILRSAFEIMFLLSGIFFILLGILVFLTRIFSLDAVLFFGGILLVYIALLLRWTR